MKNQIRWRPVEVAVNKIKPTPNNYKIKTELGKQRLTHSLNRFGLAGTAVVNTDFTLIDGNSRLEQAKERGEKKLWVSMPNRKLTVKEFEEMSAMFDFAKASEVDLDRIKRDKGSTADFYEKWGLEVPLVLLESMGAKAPIERSLQHPDAKQKDVVDNGVGVSNDIKMVQLFFNLQQEEQFRKFETLLMHHLKVDNTTDCAIAAYKLLVKTLNLKTNDKPAKKSVKGSVQSKAKQKATRR